MRILICSSTYPPSWNGQSVFTSNLAEGMTALGHDVIVLVPGLRTELKNETLNGVKIIRMPAIEFGLILHADLRLSFCYWHKIRSIFDNFQPNIVHVQDSSPHCQAIIREARRLNIPALASHHMGPEIGAPYFSSKTPLIGHAMKWMAWKFVRKHLSFADGILVPSRFSVSMLAANGFKDDVIAIPCAIRLQNFLPDTNSSRKVVLHKYGLEPEKVTLLYAGRLDIEKQVDTLIHSMAYLNYDSLQLVIAGAGSLSKKLHLLAEKLGVNNKIHFIGALTHDDLLILMKNADIFVTPGDAESFSIATLEAMAFGLPILAANSAALPELVNHREGGYLFHPGDPEDVAQGIKYLLERKVQWTRMSKINSEKAQQYDLLPVMHRYEHFYNVTILESQKRIQLGCKAKKRLIPFWRFTSNWLKRTNSIISSLIVLAVLVVSLGVSYDNIQAVPKIRLENIPPINLPDIQRVMIIAPHPDDESLGSAGLIQAVLKQGGEVRIVVVTNGDALPTGPVLSNGKLLPSSENYIQFGRERQQETLKALEILGVSEDMVYFLGYPDSSLQYFWNYSWTDTNLFGRFTHVSSSPYEITYNKKSVYSGTDLFQDLLQLLVDFKPDMVLVPHPEDTNGDHRAVSNFSQFAIASYLSQTSEPIHVLGYLVHYEGYPLPRGIDVNKPLLPPAALSRAGQEWVSYIMQVDEASKKQIAINTYLTQQKTMSSYLDSFARANEIYFELPAIDLPMLALEEVDDIESGQKYSNILQEPIRERFAKLVISGADLVAIQIGRLGDTVCFSAETRGSLQKWITYRILVKLPDGRTLEGKEKLDLPIFPDRFFGSCYNLEEMGNPDVIGVSAETWSGVMLDSTAWHYLVLSYQD